MSAPVGRVLGTQDAMPLDFWVGVAEGQYLQLDDVVVVETPLPDGRKIRLFGVVDLVRARHEGAKFDSDVFLIEEGVMPAAVANAAHVRVTRVEPEIFVPPRPGQEVARAAGLDRDQALFFDAMERRVPIGLSRDGEPVFANLDFLDGSRGAHVNISGISGVATKTSYATFLLHSLFKSGALGGEAASTHAIVFNVKGEDLLFLDQPNERLRDEDRTAYAKLGLVPEPFDSVQLLAPVRPGSRERMPATGSRQEGVQAFFWTLREFVNDRLLRFLFAEAEDASSQIGFVVDRVEAKLLAAAREGKTSDPWIAIEGQRVYLRRVRRGLDRPRRAERPLPGRSVGAPRGHGHGGGVRASPPRRGQTRGPPGPGLGRGQARRPPPRLAPAPAQRRRHPRPARPGQAIRGGRGPEAHVRGQGVAGYVAAPRVRGPRRAQQVRAP